MVCVCVCDNDVYTMGCTCMVCDSGMFMVCESSMV